MWEINEKAAKKHGLISVDTSEIHEKKKYDNPYHAFIDYPEYDEKAAAGAVDFVLPLEIGKCTVKNVSPSGISWEG
jgi:3-dehydroquinate synthetase